MCSVDSGSNLESLIKSQFASVEVVYLERGVFSESEGLLALRGLTCHSEQPILEELVAKKHLCLASSAALLKHLVESCGISFLPNTLHLDFRAAEDLLLLDPLTIGSLELLEPNTHSQIPSSSKITNAKVKSLFDVLNHTRTPQGARLLKRNLIQAPSDLNTIQFRQSCVREMLRDEKLYFGLSAALQAFSDIDPILSHFTLLSTPTKQPKAPSTSSSGPTRKEGGRTSLNALQLISHASSPTNILKKAHSTILTLLKFKRSLNGLPALRTLISNSTHPFFTALAVTLNDSNLEAISTILDDCMADSAQTTDNGVVSIQQRKSVQQRDVIYALKDGINGFLDAARRVYAERLEDIENTVGEYKQAFPELALQLTQNATRGFFLRISDVKTGSMAANARARPFVASRSEDDSDSESEPLTAPSTTPSRPHGPPSASNLPTMFILRARSRHHIEFTTEDLVSLNVRLSEARNEIVLLTSELLESVQSNIRERIGCLYKFGEAIALLDMLFSFATYVTLSPEHCCCPELVIPSHESHITIHRGFHPLILAQSPAATSAFASSSSTPSNHSSASKRVYSNTIRSSKSSSYVHIITGGNNSGKTTLLLQTAVLTLMAHMGCYIPATFASISLVDRILTRTGSENAEMVTADAGANSSSFFKEMRIASYILDSAGPHSLVLLDELGKSTNSDDGVPICFAIVERLISRRIQTLFATHFLELASKLQGMYAAVLVHRMDSTSTFDARTGKEAKEHNYTMVDGCEQDTGYGTLLASDAGWPTSVIVRATEIRALEASRDAMQASHPHLTRNSLNSSAHESYDNNDERSPSNSSDISRLKRAVFDQLRIAKLSEMSSLDLSVFLHRLASQYKQKRDALSGQAN